MNIARQLYKLQEIDLEIDAEERSLKEMLGKLGASRELARARDKLASEQQRLGELKKQQHSSEIDVDDLADKILKAEEELYSGRIKSPKELTSLQHEVNLFKEKRDELETEVLEIMGQVELAEAAVAMNGGEIKKLEAAWQGQQQQLTADIEKLKSNLVDVKQKREQSAAEIEPQALESYALLRQQKGQAVAKVEQGVCRGCRISLPFSDMQRVKSGSVVQCSSCGRILFLP